MEMMRSHACFNNRTASVEQSVVQETFSVPKSVSETDTLMLDWQCTMAPARPPEPKPAGIAQWCVGLQK
jgi:hypothetical protein